MAHADKVGSTLVLANDPDADRFTAAERYKGARRRPVRPHRDCRAVADTSSTGKWNAFTGDQIGALLASWALSKYQESGKPIEKLAMCASTVSSKMIRAMAKKEGFVFRETLTGFKCTLSLCSPLITSVDLTPLRHSQTSATRSSSSRAKATTPSLLTKKRSDTSTATRSTTRTASRL